MIAATGAKNGALWPHTALLRPQASATATPAWNISRQATLTRPQRVRIETRERSVASSSSGMRSTEGAAVLHEVEAQDRLRERAPRRLPALARVEAARAGLALGRIKPDRLVAAARRLVQREPVQLGGEAGAPPRRPQEEDPQVRTPGTAHVRPVALGGMRDPHVARRLAVGAGGHRAPGRRLPQPLADGAQLERARRRAPPPGRPVAGGLGSEPAGGG